MSASRRAKTPRSGGTDAHTLHGKFPANVAKYTINGVRLGDFEEDLTPRGHVIQPPHPDYVGYGAKHMKDHTKALGPDSDIDMGWFVEKTSAREGPVPLHGLEVKFPVALQHACYENLWNLLSPSAAGQIDSRLFREGTSVNRQVFQGSCGIPQEYLVPAWHLQFWTSIF